MNTQPYKVEAFWDREAQVWVAESEDIPGLVTEADTIEALTAKLRQMIPELLQVNHIISVDDQEVIAFELISHRQESIQCAV
jgi:predicted RNase H-like HicB family nuclease